MGGWEVEEVAWCKRWEMVVEEAAYRARVSNAVKQVADVMLLSLTEVANVMLLSLTERRPTYRSIIVVGQLHALGDQAQPIIAEIVCLRGFE